ncbi:excalibur calcium-binding domain-containing protein [Brevundimonas sp. LM2]|uniref:excalibur calcium-binding domain-containing protein n=1 Tax=Brevundimonas sp. LM2 TaxID=1938605 RepID=UPI0015C56253|nr:excalibur calcium-binding domain-containing protein [Brevundimonas sp. LM2]
MAGPKTPAWAGWAVAAVLGVALVSRCGGGPGGDPGNKGEASVASEATRPVQYLYVRTDRLNCRTEASTGSAAVARLRDAALVGVVEEANGWARLSEPDCWVKREFLGQSPRPPAPPPPVPRPQALYSGGDNASGGRRAARSSQGAYYANCSAARAAGAAPVYAGDPGYASRLDRDGDGVGCE